MKRNVCLQHIVFSSSSDVPDSPQNKSATHAATGSYTDTDSSSDKKRDKADSPNTLMGQLRQDFNKDLYRFSADYDDMPYKVTIPLF